MLYCRHLSYKGPGKGRGQWQERFFGDMDKARNPTVSNTKNLFISFSCYLWGFFTGFMIMHSIIISNEFVKRIFKNLFNVQDLGFLYSLQKTLKSSCISFLSMVVLPIISNPTFLGFKIKKKYFMGY